MKPLEIWKDVVGYEGLYKVSNKGNVYSVARKDTIGRKRVGLILKPKLHAEGYLRVTLHKNGTRKNKLIHRLVLEAFVPNPNDYPEVNHRDEDKKNNNVENLEWCTGDYNLRYGTRIERMSATNRIPVKGVHIETGEEIYLKSMAEGTLYGFDPTSISCVCSGKFQTHKGYYFRKIEKDETVEFSSAVEIRNKVYASQKLPKNVKAVNVESGKTMTFSSALEASNKGYPGVYKACKGTNKDGNRKLTGGDGHLYKGHRWSYE